MELWEQGRHLTGICADQTAGFYNFFTNLFFKIMTLFFKIILINMILCSRQVSGPNHWHKGCVKLFSSVPDRFFTVESESDVYQSRFWVLVSEFGHFQNGRQNDPFSGLELSRKVFFHVWCVFRVILGQGIRFRVLFCVLSKPFQNGGHLMTSEVLIFNAL